MAGILYGDGAPGAIQDLGRRVVALEASEGGGVVDITAADITDASAVGRAVLKAADAAAARTAIGAGTGNSSLAIGTTGTTAAAGNHNHAITADAASGLAAAANLQAAF